MSKIRFFRDSNPESKSGLRFESESGSGSCLDDPSAYVNLQETLQIDASIPGTVHSRKRIITLQYSMGNECISFACFGYINHSVNVASYEDLVAQPQGGSNPFRQLPHFGQKICYPPVAYTGAYGVQKLLYCFNYRNQTIQKNILCTNS